MLLVIEPQKDGRFVVYKYAEAGEPGNEGKYAVPESIIKVDRPGGVRGYEFDWQFKTHEAAQEAAENWIKDHGHELPRYADAKIVEIADVERPRPEDCPSFADTVLALCV